MNGVTERSPVKSKLICYQQSSRCLTSRKIVTENDFNGKIVLLDFWFTRCEACFEKFPQVQSVFYKLKSDPSVKVLAVDKPIPNDKPGEAFDVIRREGYTFPVVIAKDEELPEKYGVAWYPTTMVIDRQGKIVYRGDIEGAASMVEELRGGQ